VRDAEYKLIRDRRGEQLFKLTPGVIDDGNDLFAREAKLGEKLTPEAKAAAERLRMALDEHARSVKFAYPNHAPDPYDPPPRPKKRRKKAAAKEATAKRTEQGS
jgi:hypothetical protein